MYNAMMRTLFELLPECDQEFRHCRLVSTTYMTSRLSNSGTMSSTNVFGVFPSAVNPVEQF
jgi:hypothetical protein